MKYRLLIPIVLACMLMPSVAVPPAHADVLFNPTLTWTVYSSGSYLGPVNHLSLNYGNALTGTSWYYTVQVVNRSGSHLTVNNPTFYGDNAQEFTGRSYCNNGTCYYAIYFNPRYGGYTSAVLQLTGTYYVGNQAWTARSYSVQLSGYGVAPYRAPTSQVQVCPGCTINVNLNISPQITIDMKSLFKDGMTLKLLNRAWNISNIISGLTSRDWNLIRGSKLFLLPIARSNAWAIFREGKWFGYVAGAARYLPTWLEDVAPFLPELL